MDGRPEWAGGGTGRQGTRHCSQDVKKKKLTINKKKKFKNSITAC